MYVPIVWKQWLLPTEAAQFIDVTMIGQIQIVQSIRE